MSDLQPLLARNRYTDEEWDMASNGLCDWVVESGMYPRVVWCRRPSSPESFYRFCDGHDEEARESHGYGK